MSEAKHAIEHVSACQAEPGFPCRFIIKWTIHDHRADAAVFPASYVSTGPNDPPQLEELAADADPDAVFDFRWDGCANWNFSPRGCMLHTCTDDDVQAFAELMIYLHKRAAELIPLAVNR